MPQSDEPGPIDDEPGRIKNDPHRMRRPDHIEEVVAGDHDDPEGENRVEWEPDQRREDDHRPPECPDDEEHGDLVVAIELKPKAPDDGELEHDQPDVHQQKP